MTTEPKHRRKPLTIDMLRILRRAAANDGRIEVRKSSSSGLVSDVEATPWMLRGLERRGLAWVSSGSSGRIGWFDIILTDAGMEAARS